MIIKIFGISVMKGVRQGLSRQVAYLEKENKDKPLEQHELFFNQASDQIRAKEVLEELSAIQMPQVRKGRPQFFHMIISPSQAELVHINNNISQFKEYVREVMNRYAASFNLELNDRPLTGDDIKYYAKVEHHRQYSPRDTEVQENAPFIKSIERLKIRIRYTKGSYSDPNIQSLKRRLAYLKKKVPHKIGGEFVQTGMKKPGYQTHAHVLISGIDASNSIEISPDGPVFPGTVPFSERFLKASFLRAQLASKVEVDFDKMFDYPRTYVETYAARIILKYTREEYYWQQSDGADESRKAGDSGRSLPSNGKTVARLADRSISKELGLSKLPNSKINGRKIQLLK